MCCSYINITSITVVTSPRQQNESTTSNKTFPIYLLTCGFDYVHLVYCFLHARQREFTFDFNLLLILVQSLCIQYLHFNKKIGLRIDNKMTQVTWVFSTILIENSLRTATKYFVFFFICDALHDLVPFVQFKTREKHPWRSVTFSKVAG